MNTIQNGRQSSPTQSAPPIERMTHARKSTPDRYKRICKDFVFGNCSRGSECKFRHGLQPERIKTTFKFSPDHQNRLDCSRSGCTYLHASDDEENFLLMAGVVPVSNNMVITQPPSITVPSLRTLLASPPPARSSAATTPVQILTDPHADMTLAAHHVNETNALPIFDVSKPPPPLPSGLKTLKRPGDHIEARPSKVKKSVESVESLHERCIQREFRIKVFMKELRKLEREKDLRYFMYRRKKEIYENGKLLLKAAVDPEVYNILEQYIEASSQTQMSKIHSQYNQMATNVVSAQMSEIFSQYNQMGSSVSAGQMSDIFSQYNQMEYAIPVQMSEILSQYNQMEYPIPAQMSEILSQYNQVESTVSETQSSNLIGKDINEIIETFLDKVLNSNKKQKEDQAPLLSTSANPNGSYVAKIDASNSRPSSVTHAQNVHQTGHHLQTTGHLQGAMPPTLQPYYNMLTNNGYNTSYNAHAQAGDTYPYGTGQYPQLYY